MQILTKQLRRQSRACVYGSTIPVSSFLTFKVRLLPHTLHSDDDNIILGVIWFLHDNLTKAVNKSWTS